MGSISFNLLSDPWSIHSLIHHSLIHSLFTIPSAYICSLINSSFIHSSLIHSFFHFLVPGMPRLLPGYWAQQAICLFTLSLDVKHSRCVQRQDPCCLKGRRTKSTCSSLGQPAVLFGSAQVGGEMLGAPSVSYTHQPLQTHSRV